MAHPMPPLNRLAELFCYDPETGELTRRSNRGSKLAGTRVGTKNNYGHLICRIDYRICYVHRVAWAMHYGEEPPDIIDHVNGDGADNRIANLRAATNGLNRANSRANRGVKSGIRGVHWSSSERRWRSSVKKNGKNIHLGWFDTKEMARRAYEEGAKKHFGEFSYYNREGGV